MKIKNVRTVSDGEWIWLSSPDKHYYVITGKYLFFSEDQARLLEIAKNEILNYGFHVAKVNLKLLGNNTEYVLCLYYKDSSRINELAERQKTEYPNIRYCKWKSDKSTLKGEYSEEFLNKLSKDQRADFTNISQSELELVSVHLIAETRARTLVKAGIKNIKQLSELPINHELSKHPHFSGAFELIINYAKAITANEPRVTSKHSFFQDVDEKNIYFFDAEYNPACEDFGIFLLGRMDTNGKVLQQFIDEPKQEKDVLKEFSEWLIKEKPILVSYSSTSADKPQLVRNFKRFNLPTVELEKSFFDLYYDCISTQRIRDQRIFLPICNSIGLKEVAHYFGYREPRLEIRDGFQALSEYENFLHINEKEKDRIKKDLLNYNKADLERTKFIFEKLKNLFYMKTSLETFSH